MNKIKYMTLLLLCASLNSWAQTIVQAECFWDTDPGQGNGTPLSSADAGFNTALEAFQTAVDVPTTPGLHKFSVRLKDSNNQWGPVNTQVIDISSVPLLADAVPINAEAEYFWDTDPGQGNGIAVAAADQNWDTTFESYQEPVTTPTAHGLHTFNIRVKDSNNQWGPVNTQVVDINNSLLGGNAVPTIAAAEYFWDTDPGEGNGIAFFAADQDFNSTVEEFFKSDVGIVNPVGPHVFCSRAKDNTGAWGPVNKQVVVIETLMSVDPNPIADQYFFFPNPGTTVIRFNKEIEKVDIVDLNGRFIGTSTHTEINIADLATGTYILKVTTPDGLTFNKKMIKK